MKQLIKDLINFGMYWIFLYVCAIFILILGITHLKTNEPKTPIIQETHVHKTFENAQINAILRILHEIWIKSIKF